MISPIPRIGGLALRLVAAAAIFVVSACATDTGNPTTDRFGRLTNAALEQVGKAAFQVAASALANQAQSGFSADWGYSLQQGLYQNLPGIVSSDTFAEFADAWNRGAPAVNEQLAAIVTRANPVTPAEIRAVASTIAGAVASATDEHAASGYAK